MRDGRVLPQTRLVALTFEEDDERAVRRQEERYQFAVEGGDHVIAAQVLEFHPVLPSHALWRCRRIGNEDECVVVLRRFGGIGDTSATGRDMEAGARQDLSNACLQWRFPRKYVPSRRDQRAGAGSILHDEKPVVAGEETFDLWHCWPKASTPRQCRRGARWRQVHELV